MRKLFVFLMITLFIVAFSAGTYTYAVPAPGEKVKKAGDDPMVYAKEKGKKYHLKNCKLAATGKKGMKLSEALKSGLEPCKVCNPPGAKVYVNPNGKVFHKKGCKMVNKDAKAMTMDEAKKQKLGACKLCLAPPKKK